MKTKFNYLIILLACLFFMACNQESKQLKQSQLPQNIDWEYQMAYQRGIEAVNWSIPAVSMICMRDANFGLGGSYNTVYWLSAPPTASIEALTANNQTPYASIFLNTKEGPVVLDIPPASDRTAIFGSAVDIWQEPVADIGPAGEDKGKGGKYVFLPPEYGGKEIEGCINVHVNSYQVFVALRCIPLGGASYKEAAEYSKNINAYSATKISNPPEGEYIDMAGKHLPTLPKYDDSYFKYIKELIDTEPLQERDMVMGGMLASIGIVKDKPFQPSEKVKKALKKAITDGYDYLEYMFETPGFSFIKQWDDRQWMAIREPSNDGFVFDEGDYLLIDDRGSLFHWATFFPRYLGKATAYLNAMKDADGNFLKGEKQYKLTVPAEVPARDFWSVIVYSKKTKAWIYSDTGRVGLSSYDKENMKLNDDGSVDIYFSKTAPEGMESNWIPTNGEDFFLLFRFYGPQESYFDKSFELPDVQILK
ncbi:DUF1254 domain-containing protein [Maribellus mangrovi]|uniref:DUF1254 domain-containing protein n=1 Tax=Maribellus mangrovi TaxID=3133146 RepID=UPI0030EBC32A